MKKKFISTFLIFFLSVFESIAKDTFLSLKNDTVNVRYQPTLNSPIKYIYTKKNLPVKLIDKKEKIVCVINEKNIYFNFFFNVMFCYQSNFSR